MKPKYLLISALLFAAPTFAAVDEAPFQALKTYDFQNRKPVEAINAMIRGADAATMSDIETHLLTALQDPATTYAAHEEIGRMLRVVGTARSVPALAKWLADEKLGNVARFALEQNRDPSAGAALRAALPAAKGKALIGIINSLGERRDAAAAKMLSPLAKNIDVDVASAAVAALGKIGTREAVFALQVQAMPNKSLPVYQALLIAADQALPRKGGLKEAQAIYRPILADKAAPMPARMASARGLLNNDVMQSAPLILELLRGDDADLRAVAARFVRVSGAPTKQLSAEVEKLPAPGQALLLSALAERNDPAMGPVLLRASASPDVDIRSAAMRAFASLQAGADAQANANIALLLAKVIARNNNAESEAARTGLYGMRGAALDDAIMAAIPDAEPTVRRELVYALGQRYTMSARPLLFKIAADDTSTSQDNALSALGEVAGAADYASAVGVLLSMKNNGQRGVAENLVTRLAKLVPSEADRTAALVAALPAAPFENRVSILKVLGAQGGGAALNALRADVNNADAKIQDAAIRALAVTPDAGAMKDLLGLAANGPGKVHQILSLRGYLRLAEGRVQGGANAVELYEPALKIATEAQERRTIISGLSKTNTPQSLALITPLLDDENVRNEAALAAIGIARSIAGKNPVEARAALDKIVATSKDENTLKQANEALKAIPAA